MSKVLNNILRVLVVLPAILFLVIGLRWLVEPQGAAAMLGLTLGEGIALSTQVGDLSAFFLTLGLSMLIALVTGRRSWYYPPMLLLLLAAAGRTIAWVVHDATLAVGLMVPEIIVPIILLVASQRLADKA